MLVHRESFCPLRETDNLIFIQCEVQYAPYMIFVIDFWFAGVEKNCKCFVYVCVRFWNLLKSFALYCIFWWLFLFIVYRRAPRHRVSSIPGPTRRADTDFAFGSDQNSFSSLKWQKQKPPVPSFLLHFLRQRSSSQEVERAREKRIRCISAIRNRLQIKLWKFSGSAPFEVRGQKTAERKLFLECYDFFFFILPPFCLFSLFFPPL